MKVSGLVIALALVSQGSAQTYTYTMFDPPGSVNTTVYGINNSQQVVGTYQDSSGAMHSYVRQSDGSFTVFDAPGALPGTTIATAVNNLGQVVGTYAASTGNAARSGFIRSADGQSYTSFDVPGAGVTVPYGINDQGAVVGTLISDEDVVEGFLRSADGSAYTAIGFPGAEYTEAFGINNSGLTGGFYNLGGSAGPHGFIRNADGTYAEFEPPGFIQAGTARSMNNKGQILCGTIVVNPDGTSFAIQSTQSIAPFSINDNGAIAGTVSSGSVSHGFLAVPSGPLPTGPTIRSASGVITASAFGGFNAIAPGSWIEIYGLNLAPTTREWQVSDFTGSTAPTSLSGVSVSINGQPAFVSYISPGQVNAQAPSTVTAGPATVTVTNGSQTSAAYATTVNAVAPGILMVATDNYYAAATLPDFTTYVLPANQTWAVPSRPAAPGDTIVFYGIGFGPVTPEVSAGQITQGQHLLEGTLQVSFAPGPGQTAVPAQVTYAGLAPGTVGLYQFNVVVPNVQTTGFPAAALQFTLNGVPLPQTPTDPTLPPLYIGYTP